MGPMGVCPACGVTLPEGARFCSACGAPAEEAPPARDERKLATVLFADLVGSTALGERSDPERSRALLERFYDAMAAEIELAGGTVEKFAGDAVMAAFGAPAALEDHAERALHSALAMQRRLAELFGSELQLRIGVNTGEVVVGRPREGSSFVTGDAVNVAARLEQAAAPGEIVAGERTAAAVRGAFELSEPFPVEAKGKSEAVTGRRVVRALTLMRPRGVGGLRSAFVGRESELELLQATYRRAVEQGEPHLVTLMGDAGVGKTRLVRELWGWLAEQSPQPLQRTGRCLPYGSATYWALGEVLKEHLGILESDTPEAAVRRLGPHEILGLALGLDVAGDLHPLAARDRLHEAWVEFFSELVAEQPAVVLVEDLHWAEEPLLDLLERVLRDVRGPLLLLGTTRPELLDRRPAWGGGRRNASLVWLEPLSEDDAARMLDELLAAELPARLRDVIVERAEGNPFFVEELIGALIDQGVLERGEGGWHANELPAGFTVPDSVQSILAARIDLLGPHEKAGLQAASVIGRTFWKGPVCVLLDGAEPDCAILEDRDFIRRRSGSSFAGEQEYAFKHALTREVAYASLPKARRARLHAAFAEWLEHTGEGRDEHVPLLAHHYAEAVRPEDADLAWPGEGEELDRLRGKAVEWLKRAADAAVHRYDIDDGLALLHRALELEEGQPARSRLWREIGHANALKYDGEAFWTAMERSLEICEDRATCGETYAELAYQTTGRAGMWKTAPDRELVAGWIEQARTLAAPESEAQAKALLAGVMWGDEPEHESLLEAGRIAERLGKPELRCDALWLRGSEAYRGGRFEEALTWWQHMLDVLPEVADPGFVADSLIAPIPACVMLGRFDEARRHAAAADAALARLTPHHRVHGVAAVVELEELLARWERIDGLAAVVEEAVAGNLDTPCVLNPRLLLAAALARLALGDADEAERLEREADALGMEGFPSVLDPLRIRLALERGDRKRLGDLLREHVTGRSIVWRSSYVAARLDGLAALGERDRVEAEAVPELRPGTYLEPFALRALGRVRDDEELVRQALARFEALGLDWHVEQTRLVLER